MAIQNPYYMIQSRHTGLWEVRKSLCADTFQLIREGITKSNVAIIQTIVDSLNSIFEE